MLARWFTPVRRDAVVCMYRKLCYPIQQYYRCYNVPLPVAQKLVRILSWSRACGRRRWRGGDRQAWSSSCEYYLRDAPTEKWIGTPELKQSHLIQGRTTTFLVTDGHVWDGIFLLVDVEHLWHVWLTLNNEMDIGIILCVFCRLYHWPRVRDTLI